MYSRRFGNAEKLNLPPDYSGVAYRQENLSEKQNEELQEQEKSRVGDRRAEKGDGFNIKAYDEEYGQREYSRRERYPSWEEDGVRQPHYPRRPLYAAPRSLPPAGEKRKGTGKYKKAWEEAPPEDRGKGLLSGLLSFSGKKFSLEDIILAGLLLLMFGEKSEEKETDGELLLLLALLLLSG